MASYYDFYHVLTRCDKILIIFLVLISVSSFWLVNSLVHNPDTIIVEVGGEVVGKFDLSSERTIPVQGKIGETLIQIKNNDARIIKAPCPNKLCMHPRIGNIIVCAPNQILIRFMSDQKKHEDEFDTISR